VYLVVVTGDAWLSSACAVKCTVNSGNMRNPRPVLYFSQETAGAKSEEGGDDVKSACPLYLGLHTRYNGRYNRKPNRKMELILIKPVSVRIVGCNSPT